MTECEQTKDNTGQLKRIKDSEVYLEKKVKLLENFLDSKLKEIDEVLLIVLSYLDDVKHHFPKYSIHLIKTMKIRPPEVIRTFIETICVLKGIPPREYLDLVKFEFTEDYWTPSRRLLASNLFESLYDFTKGQVLVKNIIEFQRYKTHPHFNRLKIERAFPPCAVLYDWILMVEKFTMIVHLLRDKKREYEYYENLHDNAVSDLEELKSLEILFNEVYTESEKS